MMSTAFIQTVLALHPKSAVDLIVKTGFETLPLPCRGEILPYDKTAKSPIQFGRALRKHGYDFAFLLPPSFSAALMAYAAKIPNRIGYAESFRSLLLKPAIPYAKRPRSRHLIDEYLGLLPGSPFPGITYPELAITSEWIERHQPDFVTLPAPYIVFAPGAIFGPAKQWPVNHFRNLASLVSQQHGGVVIVGTGKDRELGEQIKNGCSQVINLCGQTTLNQLVAMLAKSKMLVSNDSGAMHIMSALSKPQVAIFGSTSSVWTSPRNPHSRTIELKLDCAPCFQRTCRFGHYHCLEQVQPERVMDAIEELLLTETTPQNGHR